MRLRSTYGLRNGRATLIVAVLALAAGGACGTDANRQDRSAERPGIPLTDETEPQAEPTALPPLPPESIPPRPGMLIDTLRIEGMPEASRSALLQAPADFPMRFSTYVPEGVAAELEGAGDSASVRFSASFTGTPDRNAYMHVRLYPRATTLTQALDLATGFVRSRAPWRDEADPVEPPGWGQDAYTFSYAGDGNVPITGRLVLGRHADRYFHVLTHYPAEYGDGLGPRFQSILEHWRWEDTGRPLVWR